MTERILIIGGQGGLGAWTAKVLLDEGIPFALLDRRPDNSILSLVIDPGRLPEVPRSFRDIGDARAVAREIRDQGFTRTVRLAGPGAIAVAGADLYGLGCEDGPAAPFTRAVKAAFLGRRAAIPAGPVHLAYVEDAARALVRAVLGPGGSPAEVRPPAARTGGGEFLRELEKLVPGCSGTIAVAGTAGSGDVDAVAGGPEPEDTVGDAPIGATPLREGLRLTIEGYRRLAREGRLREGMEGP